ncbi:MAG: FkbM family methyltransferase [Candidatus Rokuibacteriota bacterium]
MTRGVLPSQITTMHSVVRELTDVVRSRLDATRLERPDDFERVFSGLWAMMTAGLDKTGMQPYATRLNRALAGCFVPVTIDGETVRLDLGDGIARLGLMRSSQEHQLAERILRHVRPGQVAFDVGAHTGFYTLYLAARVGATGGVYAFDPSPGNVEVLRNYVEGHGFADRVRVEQAALSDEVGEADMFLYGHDDDADPKYAEETGELVSLVPSERTSGLAYRVALETLDHYAAARGLHAVDFIKIDTEGAEHHVLAGGRSLLSRSPAPIVVVELHPTVLAAEGRSADEVLEALRALDLRLYDPRAELAPVRRFEDLSGTTVLAARRLS